MKIQRSLSGVLVVGLLFMVAALAYGQGQGQGKGGGNNNDETIIVGQLTIHDDYETGGVEARLHSDMRTRTDGFGLPLPDADGDGFSDLDLVLVPNAVYQDHRLPFDSSGNTVAPDPCVTIDVTEGGADAGTVNADLDRGAGEAFQNCALFEDESGEQLFRDDARTFSIVIDKSDPGGACVCQNFGFLLDLPEAYGWPEGSEWGTGFTDTGNSCTLTPAAGPILTNSGPGLVGNPRIRGAVFAEKKVRGQSQPATQTRLNIPFLVDQRFSGDPDQLSGYNVRSMEEAVDITFIDAATRVVSTDQQDFQLVEFSGNEPVCTGSFRLPLKITVKRFEIDPNQ